ncbi:MAG: hypothetical protein OEV41_05200 [Gammaproteobacteria bacterium]|nr:hypothetical protein [Gammaproteobacteria bacterium]
MDKDRIGAGEVDGALSAAYRDIAVEKVPGHLDALVLDAARRQAAQATDVRRPAAWYRTVSFAAIAGLCAALLVSFAHLGVFGTGGDRIELSVPAPQVIAPGAADSDRLLPAEERCSEAERSTSGNWWRCIRALEARGLTRAAEAELQALLGAHPGFVEPK